MFLEIISIDTRDIVILILGKMSPIRLALSQFPKLVTHLSQISNQHNCARSILGAYSDLMIISHYS